MNVIRRSLFSRAFWLTYTLLRFAGTSNAQAPSGLLPGEEVVVEALTGYGGMVKFDPTSGPYELMGGRNALAFGVGLRYRTRFGDGQRSCLGIGFEYLRLPFTFTWDIHAKEVYGVEYPSRPETYQAERMGLGTMWITIDHGLTQGIRPVFFHAGIGAGWSYLDFYPQFGSRSVHDPDDHNVRYNIYRVTAEHRNGWVYLLRVGIGKEWCLPNLNRLGFLVYGQWSWIDDFNNGTYLAYPGTTSESRGTWQQGLNYVGVKLHYALSFGPPKAPRLP